MEQYRYYTRTELRAQADSRQIEGRVFLYGSRSVLLPDWDYGSVFEEITPGALSEDVTVSYTHLTLPTIA